MFKFFVVSIDNWKEHWEYVYSVSIWLKLFISATYFLKKVHKSTFAHYEFHSWKYFTAQCRLHTHETKQVWLLWIEPGSRWYTVKIFTYQQLCIQTIFILFKFSACPFMNRLQECISYIKSHFTTTVYPEQKYFLYHHNTVAKLGLQQIYETSRQRNTTTRQRLKTK